MKVIYVLDKNKNPLMPTSNFGKVRRLLKKKEAKIIEYKPFTIQLLKETTNNKQNLILGIDPGRTNIGLCVVNNKGQELFSSNVKTRNKDIKKIMEKRKQGRELRRRSRRQKRQRRFLKYHPEFKNRSFERFLPHYTKPIILKIFKNKEARFCNRKRKKGWLTPTATQLLRTYVNLVKKIQKFLPISEITLELNSFDFAKMENPNIKNWEYAKGKLFGFKNKEEYVYHQQDGKCLFCKKSIDRYHHVIWLSKGGSDTVDNIAGVCLKHHNLIHTNEDWDNKCVQKHGGLLKRYGALSVLNQIKNQLVEQLSQILPLNCTTGYETYRIRNNLNLNKDHYIDAWCIAISSLNQYGQSIIENKYDIVQFRRHNRRLLDKSHNREYMLNGKIVCKNRKRKISQTFISLDEYLKIYPYNMGKLTINKRKLSYMILNRPLAGAILFYKGERYVSYGTSNYGKEKLAKFLIKDDTRKNGNKMIMMNKCKIIKRNQGLVFI